MERQPKNDQPEILSGEQRKAETEGAEIDQTVGQPELPPQEQLAGLDNEIATQTQEITRLAESIAGTKTRLDTVREELGLPSSDVEPPSIISEKDALEKLQKEREDLKKQREIGVAEESPEVLEPGHIYGFHGSDEKNIKEFRFGKLGGSLGIHFGDQQTAGSIEGIRGGSGRVYKLDVTMKNPVRLTDQSSWYPETVLADLARQGKITEQEQYKALDKIRSEASESRRPDALLREYLQSLGYDGVVYLNRYEVPKLGEKIMNSEDRLKMIRDKARLAELSDDDFKKEFPFAKDSYIALDPKKIKILDNDKQPPFSPDSGTLPTQP